MYYAVHTLGLGLTLPCPCILTHCDYPHYTTPYTLYHYVLLSTATVAILHYPDNRVADTLVLQIQLVGQCSWCG
jgi:hypothetical protein